jgi:hypothetical protein
MFFIIGINPNKCIFRIFYVIQESRFEVVAYKRLGISLSGTCYGSGEQTNQKTISLRAKGDSELKEMVNFYSCETRKRYSMDELNANWY